jgi:CD2 antigen cytoplasmic tail-binding protein 2
MAPPSGPRRPHKRVAGNTTAEAAAAAAATAKQPHGPDKKPRFDARNPSQLVDDDDAITGDAAGADAEAEFDAAVLALDSIGGGGATRRSGVNLDGFDSDSDADNFDARAAARAREAAKQRKKGKDEDDDDDMFAEDDDDNDNEEFAIKKKKTVNFIDEREIEGQDWNSKVEAPVFDLRDEKGRVKDAESDSESGGDEGRDRLDSDLDEELGAGSKKKHAPRVDAFNMQAEGEEGKFDESGNFVRRADPNAVHDSWLEGVSKKEMKKAREAEAQRLEERRRLDRERDAIPTAELLGTLISHLQRGECVLEALQRLAAAKARAKPKPRKNRRAGGGDDAEAQAAADEAEARRKRAVEALSGAADALLSRGHEDVYDAERELLMRLYKREAGEDWAEAAGAGAEGKAAAAQWQFRWGDKRDGDALHGPYDSQTMSSWNEAGYFTGDVEFRRVGTELWSSVADFA